MRLARSAGAIFLLIVAATACRPDRDEGRIDVESVELQVGTGGLEESGRWNRALITARARAGVFRGDVVVSGQKFDRTTSRERFRAPFECTTTAQTIEVPFLPRPDWDAVVFSFVGERGVDALKQDARWPLPSKLRVLGIGAAPAFLAPAAREWLELPRVTDVVVGAIGDSDVPRHAVGFDVADLVVVSGTTLGGTDPEQVEALGAWVRGGGVLAVAPSAAWMGQLSRGVAELAGLAASPSVVEDPAGVASFTDTVLEVPGAPIPGTLFDLRPVEGARFLERGLLLERRAGSGRVFVFAFSPAGDPTEALRSPALTRAWRRIVEEAAGGTAARLRNDRVEGAAVEALLALAGSRVPAKRDVSIFIAAYIVVAFFVAGFIFRRRRRLEWMYLVSLILAAAASVGIYFFGFLSGIKERSVDEVTVAAVDSDGRGAGAVSFLAVASPGRRTLEPPLAGASEDVLLSQPLARYRNPNAMDPTFGFSASDEIVRDELLPLEYRVGGGAVRVPRLQLYPNASRYLRLEHRIDLGGALAAEPASDRGGSPQVTVSNGTGTALRCFLVTQQSSFSLGDVEPGATRTLAAGARESLASEDASSRSIVMQGRFGGAVVTRRSGPGDDGREGRLRRRLFAALAGQRPEGPEPGPRRRWLVAEAQRSWSPAAGLAAVRHASTFLVVELEEAP